MTDFDARPIGKGWLAFLTDDNDEYYYNEETEETVCKFAKESERMKDRERKRDWKKAVVIQSHLDLLILILSNTHAPFLPLPLIVLSNSPSISSFFQSRGFPPRV